MTQGRRPVAPRCVPAAHSLQIGEAADGAQLDRSYDVLRFSATLTASQDSDAGRQASLAPIARRWSAF
jgi:hypothetical protein